MPRIYVNFETMQQLWSQAGSVRDGLASIENAFSETVDSLDWEVRCSEQVDRKAREICRSMEGCMRALDQYRDFLDEGYRLYLSLDQEGCTPLSGAEGPEGQKRPRPYGPIPLYPIGWPGPDSGGAEEKPDRDEIKGAVGTEIRTTETEDRRVRHITSILPGKIFRNEENSLIGMERKEKGFTKKGKKDRIDTSDDNNFLNWKEKWGVKCALLSDTTEYSAGDGDLGVDGKLETSLGVAELTGGGEVGIGEKGLDLNVSGKAMVAAVKGKAEGTIHILFLEITPEVSAYLGALGVEGKFGIDDGEFVMKGGVAAKYGFGAGIRIGLDEQAWDKLMDIITFWD